MAILGLALRQFILSFLFYVAHTEREKIKTRQAEGITIAKSKNVKFGRKRIESPSNWDEVITKWKNKEITAFAGMKELGLKQTAFYKL